MELEEIIRSIRTGRFKITDHADEEIYDDDLNLDEVIESVESGEIIERYPNDTPYPSCLVFGRNQSDDEIHSVWAYNKSSYWSVLITVYRPDPNRWINWRRRIDDE